MAQDIYALMMSSELRHAYQLDHSMDMISDIPAAYDDAVDRDSGDYPAEKPDYYLYAQSMVDSFYVHIRLLAELLVLPSKPRSRISPADFDIPEWKIPSTEAARELKRQWDVASTYVVHFGKARVPVLIVDLQEFEISGKAFRAIAANALTVLAGFLREVEARNPPWTDEALIPDREIEPDAWQRRILAERTALLRDGFVESCGRVGLDGEKLLRSNDAPDPL